MDVKRYGRILYHQIVPEPKIYVMELPKLNNDDLFETHDVCLYYLDCVGLRSELVYLFQLLCATAHILAFAHSYISTSLRSNNLFRFS